MGSYNIIHFYSDSIFYYYSICFGLVAIVNTDRIQYFVSKQNLQNTQT